MMTCKEFEKYMNALQAFDKWIDDLNDLGMNIWENETVGSFLNSYIELLNHAFHLSKTKEYGSEIEFYIFELKYGEDIYDNAPYSNLKELYDYITKE